MAIKLKELSHRQSRVAPGHRACAGCGSIIAIKEVLMAVDQPVVITFATGCLEVATTIFPYSAWRVPYVHCAFENSAAVMSGVETAYLSLKKQGKLPGKSGDKDIKFIAFGGDGGTYDIGLQSLSGAMERGHDMLYVCYDNEAYMNTGIQRSGSTPKGAATSTSPAGKVVPGKTQFRKDLTKIMAAHNIPYVAQSTPDRWRDLMTKVQKAMEIKGPKFLNILSSCFRGWRCEPQGSIEVTNLAVETRFWPLYEVEDGKWKLNYRPKKYVSVEEWMKPQRRFQHILKPQNKHLVEEIQNNIDRRWDELLFLCGEEPGPKPEQS
jgi:pyruvate ferredoxin oxidoreductase beta subunit